MSKVIYESRPGRYRVEVGYEEQLGPKAWIAWEWHSTYSDRGQAIAEANRLAARSVHPYRVIDTIEGADS